MIALRYTFVWLLGLGTFISSAPAQDSRPASRPASRGIQSSELHVVDVRSYGARGDGQTNNLNSFLRAVAAATAARLPLYVPAGRYVLTFDAEHPGLPVNADLQVFGAGREQTLIQCGPSRPQFMYAGFVVANNAIRFSLRDLTFAGPSDPGPGGLKNTVITHGVRTLPSKPGGAGGGYFHCTRVNMPGEWVYSYFSDGSEGPHEAVFDDCDIEGYIGCVGYYAAKRQSDKTFRARHCYFHDAGMTARQAHAEDHTPHGHLIYLHSTLNVDIDDCRFANVERYAIQLYTEHNEGRPKFVNIRNSVFEQSCALGLRASPDAAVNYVQGCTFRTGGIVDAGHMLFVGCNFECPQQGPSMTGFQASGKIVASRLSGGWHLGQGDWEITNCTMEDAGGGVSHIEPKGHVLLKDCVWLADAPAPSAVFVRDERARVVMRGVRFEGPWQGSFNLGLVWLDGDGQVDIEDCEFDVPTQNAIFVSAMAKGTVRGRNNRFPNKARPMVAEGRVAHLAPNEGLAPRPLAAARLLSPDWNYDTYHVTGTSTIETIKLGGDDFQQRACAGTIHLIADEAWAIAGSGNVKPRTGASRTPGEVVSLTYDPATAWWYER